MVADGAKNSETCFSSDTDVWNAGLTIPSAGIPLVTLRGEGDDAGRGVRRVDGDNGGNVDKGDDGDDSGGDGDDGDDTRLELRAGGAGGGFERNGRVRAGEPRSDAVGLRSGE